MASVDVPTAVREVTESAKNYLDELKVEADAAVQRLEDFALSEPNFVEFEEDEAYVPERADQVSLARVPSLDRALMRLDLSLFDPDKYKSHTYVSEFFDFLEPKLTEFISTGGTGIDDAVQDAIFNNHRDRKIQILNDALLTATSNEGKRGFPLPTDMVQAARQVVITKYNEEDYNTSREITILIAERAQNNVQHAIDAGIRMESVQSEFTRFFHQAYIEYARQILDKFRAEQEANIQEYRGEIDLLNLQLREEEINSSLDQKFIDQKMEQWRSLVATATDRTKALISQSETAYQLQFTASDSISKYFQALIHGVAGQTNAITVASDSTSS